MIGVGGLGVSMFAPHMMGYVVDPERFMHAGVLGIWC